MTITARHALVTGSSRGIGRGIALKLAEQGVQVAVNYLRNEAAAKATLEQVRDWVKEERRGHTRTNTDKQGPKKSSVPASVRVLVSPYQAPPNWQPMPRSRS